MRAVAAMWVATYHTADYFHKMGGNEFLFRLFKTGWVGVDIFFVLSGFIMWYTTREDTQAGPFIIKRLTRIYTALWPAVALFVLFGFISGAGRPMDWSTMLSSITLLNVDPYAKGMYLYVTWTLTFELAFYVAFGLLLWLGRSRAPIVAIIVVILIETAIYLNEKAGASFPRLIADRLVYEFIIGAIAAAVARQALSAWTMRLCLILSAALLAAGIYTTGWMGMERPNAILFFGGATGLFLIGFREAERALDNLPGRAVAKSGDWSYAMYLIHPAIIYMTQIDAFRWKVGTAFGPWPVTILFVCLVIVLSWGYYRVIEKPALRISRQIFFRKRKPTLQPSQYSPTRTP